MNAFGVIDQSKAAHEMVAYGIPQAIVPGAIWGGRILQLIASAVLLWRSDWIATLACLALVAFLIPATIIAHNFWSAPPDAYGAQLVNFLKNLSMLTGRTAARRSSVSASKRYSVTMDYVFQPKVFSELRNGQAVVLLYDGLNPQPATYCYLKPHYLKTETCYFDNVAAGVM